MEILNEEGWPKFRKSYKDFDGRTYRVHAYVTYNKACPCHCSFCRNEQFSEDVKSSNICNMRTALKKFSPYIHTITFGGGEPLIFLDELLSTIEKVYFDPFGVYKVLSCPKMYMVTSGLRKQFLENKERIFNYFDRIYLTRQRRSDKQNQKAFNTATPILKTSDLWHLGYDITKKIEVVSTCYKGGLETAKEIISLIKWTAYIGSETIIFNDLQYDVTNEKYYQEHQISDDVFESVIKTLKGLGFTEKISVCFSGGYNVRMFKGLLKVRGKKNRLREWSGWYINVGFKQYHKPGTTLKIWQESYKRTFDLSIMPNGEVFTDWANKKPAKI